MRPSPWIAVCIGLALVAGCATPEVAEEYEEKTYVPEEIESALGGDDPTARAEAANQIETMEPEQSRSMLLALTRHEKAQVRLLAANSLGKRHLTDEAVVARLAEMLSMDPDVDVRVATVHLLAKSGQVRGLAAIVDALGNDSTLVVKRDAAVVLDKVTGQAFGGPFAAKFDDTEMDADDAMMSYEEWFTTNKDSLRWDAGSSRFVPGR